MVGTDNIPEMTYNGINPVLDEYGAEFAVTFIAGIVIGLIIAYLYNEIKEFIKSNKNKDDKERDWTLFFVRIIDFLFYLWYTINRKWAYSFMDGMRRFFYASLTFFFYACFVFSYKTL